VLCSIMPEQKDSEFTWIDFRDRVNNELADILGNFVNRVFVLMHKFYGGVVPESTFASEPAAQAMKDASVSFELIHEKITQYRFREALAEAMNIARIGNKLLTETEPWKLHKSNPEEAQTILTTALDLVALAAHALAPFLPTTSELLSKGLNQSAVPFHQALEASRVRPGHMIGQLPILFEKITDEFVAAQVSKLEQAKKMNAAPREIKAPIDFELFQSMDIRLVKVLEAEAIPKTKKLLKLKVDVGGMEKTVVSGIAEHYTPEDVVGKTVLYLANLAPRAIKGVQSEGMILMASGADDTLSFMVAERSGAAGDEVR
ncbi:MAG: methionine--tRNA ligase subunit beta, partial [Flavobacteriales bacterium]